MLSAGIFDKVLQYRNGCCVHLHTNKCLKEKRFKILATCLLTIRSGGCRSSVHSQNAYGIMHDLYITRNFLYSIHESHLAT